MRVTFHYRYTAHDYGGRSRSTVKSFRGSFGHDIPELGESARMVASMPATLSPAGQEPAATVLRKCGERFLEQVGDGDALLSSRDPGDALVARFGGRRLFDARSTPWLPGTTNADRITGPDHGRADALRDAMVDAERFALVGGRLYVAVTEPVVVVSTVGPRVVGNAAPDERAFRLDEAEVAVETARRHGFPHALEGVDVYDPSALAKDPVTRALRSGANMLRSAMAERLSWSPRPTVAAYAALRDTLGTYDHPGDPDALHEALMTTLASFGVAELAVAATAREAAETYELRASMSPAQRPGMAP